MSGAEALGRAPSSGEARCDGAEPRQILHEAAVRSRCAGIASAKSTASTFGARRTRNSWVILLPSSALARVMRHSELSGSERWEPYPTEARRRRRKRSCTPVFTETRRRGCGLGTAPGRGPSASSSPSAPTYSWLHSPTRVTSRMTSHTSSTSASTVTETRRVLSPGIRSPTSASGKCDTAEHSRADGAGRHDRTVHVAWAEKPYAHRQPVWRNPCSAAATSSKRECGVRGYRAEGPRRRRTASRLRLYEMRNGQGFTTPVDRPECCRSPRSYGRRADSGSTPL